MGPSMTQENSFSEAFPWIWRDEVRYVRANQGPTSSDAITATGADAALAKPLSPLTMSLPTRTSIRSRG